MAGAEQVTAVLARLHTGRVKFVRTSTNDIMSTTFPTIKWVVPGYISEGFLVLAGRQKLGKTWLAIDMALAVATGGVAMGSIPCEQGDVLYIDMENGPRRIQSRINTLYPNERNRPDLSRLEWVTEAPQIGAGFIEELERWRISVPAPRLIVIDVLQRIKPPGSMARNAYENDYSTFAPLQHWATLHGIAVVGLHHTKKGGAEDKLEALSGSNGLGAVADTTLVLDSDQNGKTLYVRGRDVEEKETALIFAGGFWSILGEAADVRRSGERNKIIAALEDHGEPMMPVEISVATGMGRDNVRQLLVKMAKAGEVHKVAKGRYWINQTAPDNSDHTRHSPEPDADKSNEFPAEPVIEPVIEPDHDETSLNLPADAARSAIAAGVAGMDGLNGQLSKAEALAAFDRPAPDHSYRIEAVTADGQRWRNGVRVGTVEEAQTYADLHPRKNLEGFVTAEIIRCDGEPPLNSVTRRRKGGKAYLNFEHGTCGSLTWRQVGE